MATKGESPADAAVFNLPPVPEILFHPDRSCNGFDWILFVPDESRRYQVSEYRRAAYLFCETCPIREACLAHGLDAEEFGLWGGWFLNPDQDVAINLMIKE